MTSSSTVVLELPYYSTNYETKTDGDCQFNLINANEPTFWSTFMQIKLGVPFNGTNKLYTTLPLAGDFHPQSLLDSFHEYFKSHKDIPAPSSAFLPVSAADLTQSQLRVIWAFHMMPPVALANRVAANFYSRLDYDSVNSAGMEVACWAYLYSAFSVIGVIRATSSECLPPPSDFVVPMNIRQQGGHLAKKFHLPFVPTSATEPEWFTAYRLQTSITYIFNVLDSMLPFDVQFTADVTHWLRVHRLYDVLKREFSLAPTDNNMAIEENPLRHSNSFAVDGLDYLGDDEDMLPPRTSPKRKRDVSTTGDPRISEESDMAVDGDPATDNFSMVPFGTKRVKIE